MGWFTIFIATQKYILSLKNTARNFQSSPDLIYFTFHYNQL